METPTVISTYKAKTAEALSKIDDLKSFRESDQMVDFVFKVAREIFDKDIDAVDIGYLLSTGGKLASAYAYLGNKAARARAERDIFQQKLEEAVNNFAVMRYQESKKISLARTEAKIKAMELNEFVIQKELAKNQWENLMSAVDKLVSFIQSAIKVKEGEKYRSSNLHDNSSGK